MTALSAYQKFYAVQKDSWKVFSSSHIHAHYLTYVSCVISDCWSSEVAV